METVSMLLVSKLVRRLYIEGKIFAVLAGIPQPVQAQADPFNNGA